MKNLFSIFIFSIFIFFSSCTSGNVLVPGESRIILKNLAVEYFNIAEEYENLKKYDKAVQYYKLSLRNEEIYLAAYYKIARCYALSKNWAEAKNSYEYLLSLDSDNIMIQTSLAYITVMSGETEKGILMYKSLLDKNPYDETLLESYVALLINAGRKEECREYFLILKEKFPDNKQISTFEQQLAETSENKNTEK